MGKKSDATPVRSCIGCRERLPKHRLIRFSADSRGRLTPDPLFLNPGRGVYLCPSFDCFKKAFKRKGAFARALRRQVRVPNTPQDLIKEVLSVFNEEKRRMSEKLRSLGPGEGRRVALSLQRIDEVIERLRTFEE